MTGYVTAVFTFRPSKNRVMAGVGGLLAHLDYLNDGYDQVLVNEFLRKLNLHIKFSHSLVMLHEKVL